VLCSIKLIVITRYTRFSSFLKGPNMLKRWIVIVLLGILVNTAIVSAQDEGSTLQAWADTPASAINLTPQITLPMLGRSLKSINTYTAAGDPSLSCASGGHSYSLWMSFVAAQNGKVLIFGLGSNYDSVIGIFKTTPTNEFRCANNFGETSDYENVTFNMVAGTRYYIMLAANGTGSNVDGTSSAEFAFITNASFTQPFQIPASGSYSIIQPGIENSYPTTISMGACTSSDFVVYYRFKPAVSGRYEFSTIGSSYDTVLAIDQGGVQVGCNQDINADNANSRLRPTLTAGQTYLITIGQTIGGQNPQTDDMVLSLRVRKL
jgi:hypothetical protein